MIYGSGLLEEEMLMNSASGPSAGIVFVEELFGNIGEAEGADEAPFFLMTGWRTEKIACRLTHFCPRSSNVCLNLSELCGEMSFWFLFAREV